MSEQGKAIPRIPKSPGKRESLAPVKAPTFAAAGKQSKSSRATADEKKQPAQNRARLNRTSVCLQGKVPEEKQRAGHGPRNLAARPKASTPCVTEENCSKCRSHRLETATYWLAQIKLSESAGKYFASAAFFRLALECKVERSWASRTGLGGKHNLEQLHQELKAQA